MQNVRISAITYLNTVPLLRGLRREKLANVDLDFTLPSDCADLLRSGGTDVGLIPAIEYQRIPGLVVLGDAAIATRQGVRSIQLLSRRPLEEVRTVAADTSSRTSVALTQIIFHLRYGRSVDLVPHAPDPDAMLERCDAAVVIGDPALRYTLAPVEGVTARDLAAEWKALTGKAFVFAFWAARRESSSPELAALLNRSRDKGLAQLDRIVAEESQERRFPPAVVRSYLQENLYFYLDTGCLDGLAEFYRLAHRHGLVPDLREMEFVTAEEPAAVRQGSVAAC